MAKDLDQDMDLGDSFISVSDEDGNELARRFCSSVKWMYGIILLLAF